eukprot:scaffold459_cov117-Isochrysis_galbana.AAC.8
MASGAPTISSAAPLPFQSGANATAAPKPARSVSMAGSDNSVCATYSPDMVRLSSSTPPPPICSLKRRLPPLSPVVWIPRATVKSPDGNRRALMARPMPAPGAIGNPADQDDGVSLREPRARPRSGAPTSRSGRPSPSRSPGAARSVPNAEPGLAGVDKPAEVPLIFWTSRTSPSSRRNRMYTEPALGPSSSSPGAPTAISAMPSPSRSPISTTEAPNRSLSRRSTPLLAPPRPIVRMLFTPPSARNKMSMAAPDARSCNSAPITTSGTPSPSTSPRAAIPEPRPANSSSQSSTRLAIPSSMLASGRPSERVRGSICPPGNVGTGNPGGAGARVGPGKPGRPGPGDGAGAEGGGGRRVP